MTSPVTITHHGRPRLILASIDAFMGRLENQEAGEQDANGAFHDANTLRLALNEMREVFLAFDERMRLMEMNTAAVHFLGLPREDVLGQDLRDLFPSAQTSPLWSFVERVVRFGEPADLTLRSIARVGTQLQAHIFPYARAGAALILANQSPFDDLNAAQSREAAILGAIAAMPGVALMRLNVRGAVEEVDDAFCNLTGFSKAQLLSSIFADLVPVEEQTLFIKALDAAIRQAGPQTLWLRILAAGGGEHRLCVALNAARRDDIVEAVWACITEKQDGGPMPTFSPASPSL